MYGRVHRAGARAGPAAGRGVVSDTWDVQVLNLPNARSHLHWRPPSHDRHTSGRHPPTILIGPSTPAQPIGELGRRSIRVPRHTFGLADCDQLHTHMTAKNPPVAVSRYRHEGTYFFQCLMVPTEFLNTSTRYRNATTSMEVLTATEIWRQRSELIHGRQKSRLMVRARAGSVRGDQYLLEICYLL